MKILPGRVFFIIFTASALRPEAESSLEIDHKPLDIQQRVKSSESTRLVHVGPMTMARVHIDVDIPLNYSALSGSSGEIRRGASSDNASIATDSIPDRGIASVANNGTDIGSDADGNGGSAKNSSAELVAALLTALFSPGGEDSKPVGFAALAPDGDGRDSQRAIAPSPSDFAADELGALSDVRGGAGTVGGGDAQGANDAMDAVAAALGLPLQNRESGTVATTDQEKVSAEGALGGVGEQNGTGGINAASILSALGKGGEGVIPSTSTGGMNAASILSALGKGVGADTQSDDGSQDRGDGRGADNDNGDSAPFVPDRGLEGGGSAQGTTSDNDAASILAALGNLGEGGAEKGADGNDSRAGTITLSSDADSKGAEDFLTPFAPGGAKDGIDAVAVALGLSLQNNDSTAGAVTSSSDGDGRGADDTSALVAPGDTGDAVNGADAVVAALGLSLQNNESGAVTSSSYGDGKSIEDTSALLAPSDTGDAVNGADAVVAALGLSSQNNESTAGAVTSSSDGDGKGAEDNSALLAPGDTGDAVNGADAVVAALGLPSLDDESVASANQGTQELPVQGTGGEGVDGGATSGSSSSDAEGFGDATKDTDVVSAGSLKFVPDGQSGGGEGARAGADNALVSNGEGGGDAETGANDVILPEGGGDMTLPNNIDLSIKQDLSVQDESGEGAGSSATSEFSSDAEGFGGATENADVVSAGSPTLVPSSQSGGDEVAKAGTDNTAGDGFVSDDTDDSLASDAIQDSGGKQQAPAIVADAQKDTGGTSAPGENNADVRSNSVPDVTSGGNEKDAQLGDEGANNAEVLSKSVPVVTGGGDNVGEGANNGEGLAKPVPDVTSGGDNKDGANEVTSAPSRKFVICGSFCTEAGLATYQMVADMAGKTDLNVLYMGAASYDSPDAFYTELLPFFYRKSKIEQLKITFGASPSFPSQEKMQELMNWADVFVPSGGNVVFMIDRVTNVSLAPMIKDFVDKGKVIMAGTEGGILAFDGGLSASMKLSLRKHPQRVHPTRKHENDEWNWMRASGLGMLRGMLCPHAHDVDRTRGWDRFFECKNQVQKRGEAAVAIDETAALAIDGDNYKILGKGMLGMGTGVYTMRPKGDQVWIRQAPPFGKLSDLVQEAQVGEEDPLLKQCRNDNPVNEKDPPDGWWAADPKKEQSYQEFIQCDKDASQAVDSKELVDFFPITDEQSIQLIEDWGKPTADGVIHPREFVEGVMRNETPSPRKWDKEWKLGKEQ